MYSPILSRFTSRDPLPLEGEPDILYGDDWVKRNIIARMNLYAYAENNPVNYVDPSGMQIQNHGIETELSSEGGELPERKVSLPNPDLCAVAKVKKYCNYQITKVKQHDPAFPCKINFADVLNDAIYCKGECGAFTTCPKTLKYNEFDPGKVLKCEAWGKYVDCSECE